MAAGDGLSFPAEDAYSRIGAALLTVVLFSVGLLAYLFFVDRVLESGVDLPRAFYLIYFSVALFIGLGFGMEGLAGFIGHLFDTHFKDERNPWMTALLRVIIFGVAVLLFIYYGEG